MDLYLQILVYQIIADLADASVHYIIYARYFFYDQQMNDYEPVHINKNSLRSICLLSDSIKCNMMLDGTAVGEVFSVVIPFDFISKISRVSPAGDEREHTLFQKFQKSNCA